MTLTYFGTGVWDGDEKLVRRFMNVEMKWNHLFVSFAGMSLYLQPRKPVSKVCFLTQRCVYDDLHGRVIDLCWRPCDYV
jgi:hypothetical protein